MLKVGKLYYVIVLEQNVQYSAIDWGITENLTQESHKDGLFMLYKVEIVRYISRMDDFLASRCSNAFQGISRRFIRKVVYHALDLLRSIHLLAILSAGLIARAIFGAVATCFSLL
jgi:hypothetical protein